MATLPNTGYFSASSAMLTFTNLATVEKVMKPVRVIFSGITTICFWEDGSKTIVKKCAGEDYDQETAVAMCIAHKMFGSKNQFKKFVESGYEELPKTEKKKKK